MKRMILMLVVLWIFGFSPSIQAQEGKRDPKSGHLTDGKVTLATRIEVIYKNGKAK